MNVLEGSRREIRRVVELCERLIHALTLRNPSDTFRALHRRRWVMGQDFGRPW